MNIAKKITTYIHASYMEMKKVVWPTRKEITKHTLLVIGISVGTAIFIGVFDYVFTKVFELIIK